MNRVLQDSKTDEPAATSLDRLHDIVLPDPIPWWPPAPIWYGIIVGVVVMLGVASYFAWRQWHRNAYRRVAIRSLATAESIAEISTLLRRTALSFSPRTDIATLQGASWCDWLDKHIDVPMPNTIREQLLQGVYGQSDTSPDLGSLRQYARDWIQRHRAHATPAEST